MLSSTVEEIVKNEPTMIRFRLYPDVWSVRPANTIQVIFSALKTNTNLKCLDMSDNRINNEDLDILIGALINYNTTLERLTLDGCHLKSKCVHLISSPSLIDLNISYNKLTNEDAKQASIRLSSNTSLKSLDMSYNQIGIEGIRSIAEVLKTSNSTLEVLDINNNNIGSKGALLLADMLKYNKSLIELYIADNSIGDEGAKSIAEVLLRNTTLKTLSISGNYINVESVEAFAETLRKNTTLTSFNILGIDFENIPIIVDALEANPYIVDFGSLFMSAGISVRDQRRILEKLSFNKHNAAMKENSFFYSLMKVVGMS